MWVCSPVLTRGVGLHRPPSLLFLCFIWGVVGPSSSTSAVSHHRVSVPASPLGERGISFYFAAWRKIILFLELNANASSPCWGVGLWAPAFGETLTRGRQGRQPCEGLLGPSWTQGGFTGRALRGSTVWCWDGSSSIWAAASGLHPLCEPFWVF